MDPVILPTSSSLNVNVISTPSSPTHHINTSSSASNSTSTSPINKTNTTTISVSQPTSPSNVDGQYMNGYTQQKNGNKNQNKIFVGGLSWDTTDETFRSYFSRFGEILESLIMRDKMNGTSRGFGFVTYKYYSSVEKVLKQAQGESGVTGTTASTVVSSPISSGTPSAASSPTAASAAAAKEATKEAATAAAAAITASGAASPTSVLSSTTQSPLSPSSSSTSNLSVVSSSASTPSPPSPDSATLSTHSVSLELDGRKIECKLAVPKEAITTISTHRTKKIFIGGVSPETTQDHFKEYFATFGNVQEALIMIDQVTGRSRGFGFVTYENEESVDKVMSQSTHIINDRTVECKKALPKKEMQLLIQQQQTNMNTGLLNQNGNHNQNNQQQMNNPNGYHTSSRHPRYISTAYDDKPNQYEPSRNYNQHQYRHQQRNNQNTNNNNQHNNNNNMQNMNGYNQNTRRIYPNTTNYIQQTYNTNNGYGLNGYNNETYDQQSYTQQQQQQYNQQYGAYPQTTTNGTDAHGYIYDQQQVQPQTTTTGTSTTPSTTANGTNTIPTQAQTQPQTPYTPNYTYSTPMNYAPSPQHHGMYGTPFIGAMNNTRYNQQNNTRGGQQNNNYMNTYQQGYTSRSLVNGNNQITNNTLHTQTLSPALSHVGSPLTYGMMNMNSLLASMTYDVNTQQGTGTTTYPNNQNNNTLSSPLHISHINNNTSYDPSTFQLTPNATSIIPTQQQQGGNNNTTAYDTTLLTQQLNNLYLSNNNTNNNHNNNNGIHSVLYGQTQGTTIPQISTPQMNGHRGGRGSMSSPYHHGYRG